ncbi:hypothetical protein HDV05_004910 [Chytridiales sp. JEL 0842]|nr:hypothetical protein HDV05_004910 [Chytridiales sp. JEL 0842]
MDPFSQATPGQYGDTTKPVQRTTVVAVEGVHPRQEGSSDVEGVRRAMQSTSLEGNQGKESYIPPSYEGATEPYSKYDYNREKGETSAGGGDYGHGASSALGGAGLSSRDSERDTRDTRDTTEYATDIPKSSGGYTRAATVPTPPISGRTTPPSAAYTSTSGLETPSSIRTEPSTGSGYEDRGYEETEEALPHANRKVAVAIDGSVHSDRALEWLLDNFMLKEGDMVILLNARPIIATTGKLMLKSTDTLATQEAEARAESHQLLQRSAQRIRARVPAVAVQAIALRGDARHELVRKVDEMNVDAFIMGSRGLGALKRTFVGSTSDYCVHHANCPVVIVRYEDSELAAKDRNRQDEGAERIAERTSREHDKVSSAAGASGLSRGPIQSGQPSSLGTSELPAALPARNAPASLR